MCELKRLLRCGTFTEYETAPHTVIIHARFLKSAIACLKLVQVYASSRISTVMNQCAFSRDRLYNTRD